MTDNDYVKLVMSVLGVFLVGVTTLYSTTPNATWIALVMAGLSAVGPYLLGYWQVNPRNQPRTPVALLESVHASTISPEAKAAVTPVLVDEATKPPETKSGA